MPFALSLQPAAAPLMPSTSFAMVQEAHELAGHHNEVAIRKIAQHLGWEITRGPLKSCEGCAAGKAQQKDAAKHSKREKATEPGEWMFMGIMSLHCGHAELKKAPRAVAPALLLE